MLSESGRLLAEDHHEVDRALEQLESALEAEDFARADAKLDLFWARLAVHIRAEHLHLFPTVLTALEKGETFSKGLPSPEIVQTTIAHLREDHDFFMHELANAVALVREMRKSLDDETSLPKLKQVAQIVAQVKRRLAAHNMAEELQVYRWVILLLESAESAELASRIEAELRKRPPRFADVVWTE